MSAVTRTSNNMSAISSSAAAAGPGPILSATPIIPAQPVLTAIAGSAASPATTGAATATGVGIPVGVMVASAQQSLAMQASSTKEGAAKHKEGESKLAPDPNAKRMADTLLERLTVLLERLGMVRAFLSPCIRPDITRIVPNVAAGAAGAASSEVTYAAYGTYVGAVDSNNLPHGNGRMVYVNGDIYIGLWEHGKANGRGTLTTQSGSTYEGQWVNDRLQGIAVVTFPDVKVRYEGNCHNSLPNGQGTMTYPSGAQYNGMWSEGRHHGRGVLTVGGDRYDGDWANNQQNGQGTFALANGERYVGGWKNGHRDGQGIANYSNGSTYNGLWRDDLPHGQGTYTSAEFTYVGNFVDGRIEGRGKMTEANGDIYEGQYLNGSAHGSGILTSARNKFKYDGAWVNGLREGRGTWIFNWDPNVSESYSDYYYGSWRAGKRHGDGRLCLNATYERVRNSDGRNKINYEYYGAWENDEMHGQGRMKYADMFTTYTGEWRNGKRHGRGKLANGDDERSRFYYMLEGEWNNDRADGQFLMIGCLNIGWEGRRVRYVGNVVNEIPSGQGTLIVLPHMSNLVDVDPNWKIRGIQIQRLESSTFNGRPLSGTLFLANGDRYEGEFGSMERKEIADAYIPQGRGVYITASGKRRESQWTNGVEQQRCVLL